MFSTFALIGDTFQARIRIWKCWFLRRGENRSTRRKTSRSREENQQQTQPTYDAGSGNRTRDTLVRGERSHHCAIPALQDVGRGRRMHTKVLEQLETFKQTEKPLIKKDDSTRLKSTRHLLVWVKDIT